MENQKISITAYSVEKITVNVPRGRLKPIDVDDESKAPDAADNIPF